MISICNLNRTKGECARVKPHNQPHTYTINNTGRDEDLDNLMMLMLCKQNYRIRSSYRYMVMLLWMPEHNVKDCRYSVIGAADESLLINKKVYSIAYCFEELAPAARVRQMNHTYTYYTTYYIAALTSQKLQHQCVIYMDIYLSISIGSITYITQIIHTASMQY